MKKVLMFMLAFTFVQGVFSQTFEVDNIAYNVTSTENRTVEVTSKSTLYVGWVTIPSEVNYGGNNYIVKDIAKRAFYNCQKLTGVTMPNTIKSIGAYAFSFCDALQSIQFSQTLESISERAFQSCSALYSMILPNSVSSIGEGAFYGCSALTGLIIPNSLSNLGSYVFNGCSGITAIMIYDAVLDIDYSTFGGCDNLAEITVDHNNKRYSSVAGVLFNKAKTKLILCPICKTGGYFIPEGVDSIAGDAFYECSKLSYVIMPTTLVYVGSGSFNGCSNLANVTLPTNLVTIGSYAFSGCSTLSEINIPASLKYIGFGAFDRCYNLAGFTIDNENKVFSVIDGVLYNYNTTKLVLYPNMKSSNYIIPDFVDTIGEGAFADCNNLIDIELPESVKSIEDDAFYSCKGLKKVGFSGSLKKIGYGAFSYCDSLTSLEFPNSLDTVVGWAFQGCLNLKNIIIPSSVKYIGMYAFSMCDKLDSIKWPDSATKMYSYTFWQSHGLSNIILPETLTEIEDGAFYGCTGLRKISIAAKTPPIAFSETFYEVDKQNCILEVPIGSSNLYKNTDYWKDFYTMNEIEFPTGLKDHQLHNIMVYTTDCGNQIVVVVPESYKEFMFELYDLQGKKMISLNIENNVINQIPVYKLKSGLYLYKIVSQDKSTKGKISL
jgi:hypothetical protein